MSNYFGIAQKSVGTRFNWYTSSSDWKPFHHDSAAFNPERARNQNITVGCSLGSTRELAFLSAKTGEKIYFPQVNGMMFAFGRDVNIKWKHAINALSEQEQKEDNKGRISIILWGLVTNTIEESDSPPLLTDNTRGNGYSMHRRDGGRDRHHQRDRDNYRRDRDDRRDRDNRRDRDDRRDYRSRSRDRGENHRQRGGDQSQICRFGVSCRDKDVGRCNRQHIQEEFRDRDRDRDHDRDRDNRDRT